MPLTTTGPDALAALQVNPDTGLMQAEVAARRAVHGFNEVTERKGHPALAFLGKFWGMSAWMLELIMVFLALSVDQSAPTGESMAAHKEAGDMLSSGSVVRQGEGNGVVVLTGAQTYFGRTTELVQLARPKLHIEAVVARVVRWLVVIVGALLGLVIVISLIDGAPLIEMVPLMLVLLMSAVPVALPVMFTVSMALGSKELA